MTLTFYVLLSFRTNELKRKSLVLRFPKESGEENKLIYRVPIGVCYLSTKFRHFSVISLRNSQETVENMVIM